MPKRVVTVDGHVTAHTHTHTSALTNENKTKLVSQKHIKTTLQDKHVCTIRSEFLLLLHCYYYEVLLILVF